MTLYLPDRPLRLSIDLPQGFSNEEFFQLCQNNPDLHSKRSANHEVIIAPAGFALDLRELRAQS